MKIVIDIPEELYEEALSGISNATLFRELVIEKSTPLPKGHGRLIDADALLEDVMDNAESYFAEDFAHIWLDKAPTIVEAEG